MHGQKCLIPPLTYALGGSLSDVCIIAAATSVALILAGSILPANARVTET